MSNAGKGIKIAILDSGIDQTHPAFQDSTLPMPAGFPLCTAGHPEDCAYTTNKVIVARSYVRMLAAGSDPRNPAADSMPDDYSPRDRDGHGTAVASCAAANSTATPAITTTGGPLTIMGMAPKAYLGNYKITGSPGVLDGASEATTIQAVEDALADGMDIASLSVIGPAFTGALDTGAICGLPNGPNIAIRRPRHTRPQSRPGWWWWRPPGTTATTATITRCSTASIHRPARLR
jgi:minor extracellular serine protease Vpr